MIRVKNVRECFRGRFIVSYINPRCLILEQTIIPNFMKLSVHFPRLYGIMVSTTVAAIQAARAAAPRDAGKDGIFS